MSYNNRESVREKLKLSFNDVKNVYINKNCLLLSEENEYENESSKLRFICSCGKEDIRTFSTFKHRNGMCCDCVKEKNRYLDAIKAGNDFKTINNLCLDNNIKLLTIKNYYKPTEIITYICSCGFKTSKSIKYFKSNQLCTKCRVGKIAKEKYYKIKETIENTGCKLLTSYDEYENKETILKIVCACGDIFNSTYINFIAENKQQCNKCGIKLRSGENAPRWNGGVTSESDKIRKSSEYKEWRSSVFERDNYTCQCCGDNSGGNLEAHHKENFSEFKDLRFDINNGICLCSNCHNPNQMGSFHNLYGTFNNTTEQLTEYILSKQSESQQDSLLLCSNL